jgi:DNA-binding NarL/FixJ family response regulator
VHTVCSNPITGAGNTEVRAALRDNKRVSVAIKAGASTGIKMLIGTVCERNSAYSPRGPSTPTATRLTAREQQILRLITGGLHNKQIAARIHRSIKTVEKHCQNLHTKLSTHEVAGLTRHALELGLMDNSRNVARRLVGAKQLTPRELEILKLVAQGSGNKWIASELHRSIKTVDHHRENIMKKLGIHDVAGLTWYAFSLGLM